jgi:hypothetical protein
MFIYLKVVGSYRVVKDISGFIEHFLRPNLFASCNNTFSKWWENVKDGL